MQTSSSISPSSQEVPPNAPETLIFPIDADHAGISLAVPILAVIIFFAIYVLASWFFTQVIGSMYSSCVALALAIVVAAGGGTFFEARLKRAWPSGRTLSLNRGALTLQDTRRRQHMTTMIHWDHRVNVLAWRFSVRRGSARIPKGWIMLGLQLLQDETQATIYTFMPDKRAKTLPGFQAFTSLTHQAEYESAQTGMREKIEQRRLHKAEHERHQDGAELRQDDFQALLDALTIYIPDWQHTDRN